MSAKFDLDAWGRYYKVVYYPEFGYMLSRYLNKGVVGSDWVEAQIIYHLARLKTLALYFDFIYIPFGHLLTPLDEPLRRFYQQLSCENDFVQMVTKRIIIASTWRGTTMQNMLENRTDFLRSIAWPVESKLSSAVNDVLHELWVYERNVTGQSEYLLDKALALVKQNEHELGDKYERLIRILHGSNYRQVIPFVHEDFVYKIIQERDPTLMAYLRHSNTEYWRSGEYGNPNTIIYYVGPDDDNPRRRSLSSGAYASLYTPEFFRLFLSLFIEARFLECIENVSIDAIQLMRSLREWREAVDYYHQLLAKTSVRARTVSVEKETWALEHILESELALTKTSEISYEYAISLVFSVLGKVVGLGHSVDDLSKGEPETLRKSFVTAFSPPRSVFVDW